MTMNEEWRPVVGYEGLYEVSSTGNVKTVFERANGSLPRLLKPYRPKGDYARTGLTKNGKVKMLYIHRLVARAFIGECPKGCEVNHIDHDRTNNHYFNLEYVTRKENIAWSMKAGRRAIGEKHYKARLTREQVEQIRLAYATNDPRPSQLQLAEQYGVHMTTINHIITNRTWKAE